MIELTCEQCKKSFEGLTNLKRFCALIALKKPRRGSQKKGCNHGKERGAYLKLGGLITVQDGARGQFELHAIE